MSEWLKEHPEALLLAIGAVASSGLFVIQAIVARKLGPIHKRIDQNREANQEAITKAMNENCAAIDSARDAIISEIKTVYAREDTVALRIAECKLEIRTEKSRIDEHLNRCHGPRPRRQR